MTAEQIIEQLLAKYGEEYLQSLATHFPLTLDYLIKLYKYNAS